MSHGFLPPVVATVGLAMQPAIAMSFAEPSLFGSASMQFLLTGLLTAGFLYLTSWFHNRRLKISIENIGLQAEETAAELKSQAGKVDKIAESTAATHMAQVEIGVKVNGQMTALQAVIEGLRSDLAAAKLAIVTEEEKAEQLAIQAVKDKAESEAKLVAAQQVPSPTMAQSGAGVPLAVSIPTITVPVHDDAPPAEPSRIVKPS